MAELIASGTAQSAYVDVIVTTTAKALFIKGANGVVTVPAGAQYQIAHKTPNSDYLPIAVLDATNAITANMLSAPGTYGVRRMATVNGLGVAVVSGLDVEG